MIARILRLGIGNPVLLNLVFMSVVLAGGLAWWQLPKEEFPNVTTNQLAVKVTWAGASPEDLEDLVMRPLEDALDQVSDIKHVYGDATESVALMQIEPVRGADVDALRQLVDRAVGNADLPLDATVPKVLLVELNIPLAHIALTGDPTRVDLADALAAELASQPGVTRVETRGAYTRVIRVELDRARMAARGIGQEQVAVAIRAASAGVPAGRVDLQGQRVLVRTPHGLHGVADIGDVPLLATGGATLRVRDVGRVIEDWEAPEVEVFTNGQPAIEMLAFRADVTDALKVVPELYSWAERRADTLPKGLDLVAYDDGERLVRDRIDTLLYNGLVGVGLVALCLMLFIGPRNAALVVWGMPMAYGGALVMMYLYGNTVNAISTFALLLVTGIIVDDAIIIVENVQRHLEMGKGRVRAAIDGTEEVFGAVMAATVTTCLAFAPLATLDGVVGSVMAIIPSVVIFSLLASLGESFFVLPGHLAHYAKERPGGAHDNLPTRMLKAVYAPVLLFTMQRGGRYLGALGVLIFVGATFALGSQMRLTLQTEGNPYFVRVNVDLPASAHSDDTRDALARVEQAAVQAGAPLMVWYYSLVGRQSDPMGLPTLGPNFGQLKLGFHNQQAVFDQVPDVIASLREHLDNDPALSRYAIELIKGGPPSGKDIDVKVRSRQSEQVLPALGELRTFLQTRPAVGDIRDEGGLGGEQFVIHVDHQLAAFHGLSEAAVASATRAALDGSLAVQIPIMERSTEVRVSLAGVHDMGLEAVRDLPIVGPQGTVRLRQVATVERERSIRRVARVDGQRAIRLTAVVDPELSTPEAEQEAFNAAFADTQGRYPDAELFVGGALADSAESFSQLPMAALLALVLVYGVLAAQFRSYVQPFIILTAIPLGGTGVILGLFLAGMDLSFIALIGAVALIGIVVNDSLVLVEFINRARARGLPVREAVYEAGLTRLRPILITTVTTVLGLAPLGLGIAGSDPLLAPMAISVSFGLAFATALTLLTIPIAYLVVDDISRAAVWVWSRLVGSAASPVTGPHPSDDAL